MATINGYVSNKSTTVIGNINSKSNINGSIKQPTTIYVTELNFNNRYEFPSIGDAKTLYIANDKNSIYRFCNETNTYICVGSDYNEIEAISVKLKE